ncbi:hypothetical protein DSUL_170053 [Desulfovibrionales bacterium]
MSFHDSYVVILAKSRFFGYLRESKQIGVRNMYQMPFCIIVFFL